MKTQLNLVKVLLSLLIIALLIGPAACRPQEQELAFEVLAQGEGFAPSRMYAEREPDFLIITKPDEVDNPALDVQYPPDLIDQIRAVDYQNKIVLVVLRGSIGALSPEYTVEVLEVVRAGDNVVLKTHFGNPSPESVTLSAFSSPYQVVTVKRDGRWEQNIKFVLEVDGKAVKEHTHFIP
ncbi:MAG TPA: protease complex subunit PrcB family protein [Thermoguttaceae bacterium]